MALCPCFFQGLSSKPWMVLFFCPIMAAVFATFLPAGHGIFLLASTLSAVSLYLGRSTLISSKLSTQKLKEASTPAEKEPYSPQDDAAEEVASTTEEDSKKKRESDGFLLSESEGNAKYSSTEDEDDRFSDVEWPYNVERRVNCSDDGSISDEESLIEIAIPGGHFIPSPDKDSKRCRCCKLSQESIFLKNSMDLEDDNLIEIDIYMGIHKVF